MDLSKISSETITFIRTNEKDLAVIIEPYKSLENLDIISFLFEKVEEIVNSNSKLS